jgi:Tol biopolymer transport system component
MTRSYSLKALLAAASVATLTVLLAALLVPVQPADAAFPGQNGRLVFAGSMSSGLGVENPEGDYEIFTINPDGTGLVQLTHNSGLDYDPAWSPDGESIAFSSDSGVDSGVYVMNADGTNQRRVTDFLGGDPSWSPSGEELAFRTSRHQTAENPINSEIYVVKVDGTDERRLTNNTASELMPEWSPSGEEIAYYSTLYSGVSTVGSDILVMNSDGTNQRKVTDTPGYDYDPDWSPDGREITFLNYGETGQNPQNIYKIRADGTGLTNLTDTPSFTWWTLNSPSWSPDGKKIAFWGWRVVSYDNDADIFTFDKGIHLMNPDGSGVTKIPGTDDFSAIDLDWQPKPPDTTPPSVTSTSPKANANEVAPTANVKATFSEDMDSTTIDGTTFQLFKKGTTTQIPAQVSYNAGTDTARLDPNKNLSRGVAYKAVVTTWAKDVAGNRLDQDSSTSGFQQMRWFFRVDN